MTKQKSAKPHAEGKRKRKVKSGWNSKSKGIPPTARTVLIAAVVALFAWILIGELKDSSRILPSRNSEAPAGEKAAP